MIAGDGVYYRNGLPTFLFGVEGRVVVIGSNAWLRPDELQLGDNKRLLINILDWLGRRRRD